MTQPYRPAYRLTGLAPVACVSTLPGRLHFDALLFEPQPNRLSDLPTHGGTRLLADVVHPLHEFLVEAEVSLALGRHEYILLYIH